MWGRVYFMKKLIITITALSASLVSVAATGIFIFANNDKEPVEADVAANTLIFDSNTAVNTMVVDSKNVDYGYTYSSLGNKYGFVQKYRTVDREEGDLITHNGTGNFIYFSYGDINNDGTYTEAHFASKVNTVKMNIFYTASNDYKLYVRVYYSSDGTYSDSYRLGYTVTKETSEVSFDLSNKDAQFIRLAVSNGFANYHIQDLTIEYNC